MADTTYATVADFKARNPNIRNTSYDIAIQAYENASARLIDRYTRRLIVEGQEVFSATSSTTRYFDDRVGSDGILNIDDAVTITAITRDAVAITEGTDYEYRPYQRGNGPITALYFYAYRSYPYVRKLAITGTWGYCTADDRPPEIKEAVLIQATRMYERANLAPEQVVQMVVNPFRGLDPTVEELIRPYRRMVYVA